MKKRVKTDSSILSFVIILTGFLGLFPGLYYKNIYFDNFLDFLGIIVLLKGVLLRMIARGHKKAFSKKGEKLVTTGLYTITRNPMYLGSFLLGAGFVLIVWPWWTLIIFALLFYLRFIKQIKKEEELLSKLFGKDYDAYCKKVPRIFPTYKIIKKIKPREIFNFDEAFSTKEKRGLLLWPLLAIILETVQELIVFRQTNLLVTITIVVYAFSAFAIGCVYSYQKK